MKRRGRIFHVEETVHLQALRQVLVQTMSRAICGSVGASGGCQQWEMLRESPCMQSQGTDQEWGLSAESTGKPLHVGGWVDKI